MSRVLNATETVFNIPVGQAHLIVQDGIERIGGTFFYHSMLPLINFLFFVLLRLRTAVTRNRINEGDASSVTRSNLIHWNVIIAGLKQRFKFWETR